MAVAFLFLLGAYLGAGAVFAVPFVIWGAGRIDPNAAHGSLGFRLLIAPGAAAFWPLLAVRWLRGAPAPVERNAHRDATRVTGRTR